jgi:hypothetical protein
MHFIEPLLNLLGDLAIGFSFGRKKQKKNSEAPEIVPVRKLDRGVDLAKKEDSRSTQSVGGAEAKTSE